MWLRRLTLPEVGVDWGGWDSKGRKERGCETVPGPPLGGGVERWAGEEGDGDFSFDLDFRVEF